MKGTMVFGNALILTLFAFPALADPPNPASDAHATIFSTVPVQGNEVPALPAAVETTALSEFGGSSTEASCTAQCGGGITRTCSAGTSCNAVDRSCPEERGYCWDNLTGYSYCPDPCPADPPPPDICYAWANCSSGPPLSCQGTGFCIGVDGCFVFCNGTYQYCPGEQC